MNKKFVDKVKEGVSVEEMENFAHKYTFEVFATLSVLIGAVSSMYNFFTGPKLTIFFLVLGMIYAIFSPVTVEKWLKKYYSFISNQEKMTQFMIGGAKILVSLVLPFLLFALLGLLAGTSFHYYSRQAQIVKANTPRKKTAQTSNEEHD